MSNITVTVSCKVQALATIVYNSGDYENGILE